MLNCEANEKYGFFKFIYLERERDGACTRGGEGQRERGRQRIPSRLPAVSAEPDVGLELTIL